MASMIQNIKKRSFVLNVNCEIARLAMLVEQNVSII